MELSTATSGTAASGTDGSAAGSAPVVGPESIVGPEAVAPAGAGTPGADSNAGVVMLAVVQDTPLSVDVCLDAVRLPGVGGTALFVGTVRDHDHGKGVVELEYSAHPRAEAEIARVAAEIATLDGVRAVAAVHRVGQLEIGDLAVVVAAGAVHRAEAFAACRRLIDDVKDQVPIWKHQVFEDGSSEWVGAC